MQNVMWPPKGRLDAECDVAPEGRLDAQVPGGRVRCRGGPS